MPSVSNSLDPDQACRFVESNLGLNCLQKLLADDTGRLGVKLSVLNVRVASL